MRKMLNTAKSLKLFHLLNKHIPANSKDVDVLSFVGKIVDSIIANNEHRVYTDAILLMNNIDSVYLLKDEEPEEILQIFIDGLVENRIVSLVDFFRKVKDGIF